MKEFCSAVAEGPWHGDKDATRLFPSSGNQSLIVDEYTQSLWRSTNIGVKILQGKVGVAKIAGVQSQAHGKAVSRSKDGDVYAICDLHFDSRYSAKVACVGLELSDTETFWSRVFDEVLTHWKEGPPSGSSIKSGPPDKFAPSPYRPNDHYRVTAHRLADAILALLRNPGADLKLARVPTAILRDWPDPYLTNKLVEVVNKDNPSIRIRTAEMLAGFDDPAIVDKVIVAFKDNTSLPAARLALTTIAGKDLGGEPKAWQEWWKENRKPAQDRFDARMQDACSSLRVWTTRKTYHLIGCPSAQNPGYPQTIKEARAGAVPCPKCKPPRAKWHMSPPGVFNE